MAEVVPPKFKPFTKMRVLLTLEPTPAPMDHATDILSAQPVAFRTGAAEPVAGAEVPGVLQMFGKKKREAAAGAAGAPPRAPGAKKPRAPREAPGDVFPGLMAKARTVLGAAGAEGPQVYARMNVLSRDAQAAEIARLPEVLQAKAKTLLDVETTNPYEVEPAPPVFVPVSRRGFGSFLVNQYGPIFPRGTQKALDVATCAAAGAEGQKEVKVYHYQAFVREYLRYETPYRGLLVYHGLGSGKTCSAIAAAEALFGTRGLKVIVMTPFSLRDNFISEISFCGFKHFRLQNHWVSMSLEASPEGPDPEMVKMFAKSVYGIPEAYFAPKGRARTKVKRIWIPDFDKESEPNFQTLSPEERNEIQTQLKTTIENRIKFINYNGITARELKTMVCSTPDIFDNAVIVVDEIHNLTRLIQGSLEPYFSNPTGRRRALPLETLSPDRKKLPLCGMTKAYMRGYLFYRLFMDAKNTKIIGLSGTPLINFPEELGILSNILHGPMNVIKFVVKVEAMRDVNAAVEKLVATNEDLDTVFFKAGEGVMSVTVTRLPEQFTKVFGDEGDLLGIKRRNPDQAVPTLAAVWDGLQKALKADNVQILGAGELKAQELLPSWDTPFRGAFLQEDGVTLKNDIVLQKRLRGLISYYRGIQGSVMPRVIKDEIVGVPLTGYSLKVYNKLRNEEIKTEMKKPKQGAGGKDDIWAEAAEIATMKSPSNYRMSSRQACNFVFPDGVVRPRPRNLDEQDAETGRDRDQVVDADVEDRAPGREDEENEEAVEAEEAVIAAQVAADVGEEGAAAGPAAGAGAFVPGARERAAAYKAAIKTAKEKLRAIGKTHLRLDGPPDKNLSRYSPKFAAMLSKILSLSGSSLIYSQFLEMEGVGIFAICMEANDFEPIEVIEADGGLRFSERTIKSLAKGPKVKENRYIEFTGAGSKEQRAAAVNVFNARIDKLNPEMAKVLREAGWEHNRDGGLCRVFCITSAGAEGLSLKCVRGVHIMEPYWNTVRTQQVKGRAVRICSHMDLPEDQQNVEIYTYCSIIPDEASAAGAIDKTIERSDVYSAKEAGDLGVPIPAPMGEGGEVPAGLFLPVEQDEKLNAEAAPAGAEGAMYGAVRFYSKLDNEYRGFSNFAPAPVVIEGKRYPTVEHYFQAMKFTADPAWAEAIRVAPTPAKAKQLGQSREHPIRDDWDKVKDTVMLEGLRAKFKQNRGLLEQLKGTGSRPIVEANPGDSYWGEGRTGKGKNRMGKLLEQVREELREYVIPAEGPDAAAAAAPAEAVTEDFFGGEDDVVEEGAEGADAGEEEAAAAGAGGAGAAAPVQEGGAGGAGNDERTIILTSDQRVLLISLRKEKVIGALQNIMKSVAVDCEMNFADNNDGTYRCLNLGESVGDFAFHPDLQQDIEETEARFKKRGAAEAAPPAAAVAPVVVPLAPPPAAAPLAVAAEEGAAAPPAAPPAAVEAGEGEAIALAAPAEAAVAAPPPPPAAAPPPPPPAAAPPPPPEAPKPKPKRVVIKGTTYYYQLKLGTDGKPQGFLLFDQTDDTLSRPTAYIAANPKGMPTGPILPPPA